ncbi:MAG TPA: sigma-70 family RNA polymerase sigma factor [Actinomycetota bacterium]|nr:sigma-70 family RNA polymerase sigma factor [Actinomycetota bacterium]
MWIADLEGLSDEELIRRFVDRGLSEAVDVLLRRHQNRVFGLAYRILGNRADALDASQEVFISVFRKAKLFRHQSAFTTWLYRLTVNACTDLGRRRTRSPLPAEAIEVPVPDGISRADDRMVIDWALRHLPVDQRLAVILRDLYGLSYDEIAEATGAAVGTVKSRIARGRAALCETLAPQPGTRGPGRPSNTERAMSDHDD